MPPGGNKGEKFWTEPRVHFCVLMTNFGALLSISRPREDVTLAGCKKTHAASPERMVGGSQDTFKSDSCAVGRTDSGPGVLVLIMQYPVSRSPCQHQI